MPKIMAERLGLDFHADSQAIVDRVNTLADENRLLKVELGRTGDPAFDKVMRVQREIMGGSGTKLAAEELVRFGETPAQAILRRFNEHQSRAALEGRGALGFTEFMKHDAVVAEPLHKLAASDQTAPETERAARVDKVYREVVTKARALRAMDPTLTQGQAEGRALAQDDDLNTRYRAAALGLPEGK